MLRAASTHHSPNAVGCAAETRTPMDLNRALQTIEDLDVGPNHFAERRNEAEELIVDVDWARSREAPSTWQPVPVADLLTGSRPPIATSLLARSDGLNLLYSGRLHSFVGETESLKTWGALAAVTQELQAGNHVIFIDFEDSAETIVLD